MQTPAREAQDQNFNPQPFFFVNCPDQTFFLKLDSELEYWCVCLRRGEYQCLLGAGSHYLLISHVVGAGGGRLLHGNQGEHLEQVVLHDVAMAWGQVLFYAPLRTKLISYDCQTSSLTLPLTGFVHARHYSAPYRMMPKSSK